MDRLAWVCLGSAIGGGARYLVALAGAALIGPSFPWGTLTVNVVGSFLIGVVMQTSSDTDWISPMLRLFLTTGIIGGFTTYSAFNYETLRLASDGRSGAAAANAVATLALCAFAGLLGVASVRALVVPR